MKQFSSDAEQEKWRLRLESHAAQILAAAVGALLKSNTLAEIEEMDALAGSCVERAQELMHEIDFLDDNDMLKMD